MRQNTQVTAGEYEVEYPEELKELLQDKAKRQHFISEADVLDLEYIDVRGRKYNTWKRLIDVVVSALGLLVLFIPLLLVCLVIYVDDPGKVVFSQYRIGLNGKRFKLYKLRTMQMNTPKYLSTQEVEDPDKYITRVGHILRKLSIDELPQLMNVLKGDMSLVGPRPLISDEYEIHQMRMRFGVYNVRPGLTGLAQINGRDMVTPAEKVRWDVEYLKKYGFAEDMSILFSTVPRVFKETDVVEGHHNEP